MQPLATTPSPPNVLPFGTPGDALLAPMRGRLIVAACRSGAHLSGGIADRCRETGLRTGEGFTVHHESPVDFCFHNSETCVRLAADVDGADVYICQCLCDPASGRSVDDNYLALLIAARAFREYGAGHVTAVVPYLAYGRQDKPTGGSREPVTARLMADLTISAGADRLITWHPHCGQLRGFYGGMPVHFLSPLALFEEALFDFTGRDDAIVVAPDAGAARLAMDLATALGIRFAVGVKTRPGRDRPEIAQIAGDFEGANVALVVDDELGTGGTLSGLVEKLIREHGVEEVHLAVSHNRCVDVALDRLIQLHRASGLERVLVTDSVPQTDAFRQLPFLWVLGLADPLSEVITGIHSGKYAGAGCEQPR